MKTNNRHIAIFLGHPAHYHLFKNVTQNLLQDGYQVTYLVKRKDILEDLVRQSGVPYIVVRKEERKATSKVGLVWSVLRLGYNIRSFLCTQRPRLLIGTCGALTPLHRTPIITCNEDDAAVVPRFAWVAYPGASAILNPTCCDSGRWNKKATKYPSYQELAYLHPNHFTPSKEVVKQYGINPDEPYFILRFASLHAHHDSGIKGINTAIAQHLIDLLQPHGRIYITAERPLEPQFEPLRIHINPLDMHHIMAFASLYLGDSQTMAAEAGVLGTPFVRFNDFVGRIGYLRELEDVYRLGYGIHASELPLDSPIKRADGTPQPCGEQALYRAVEELVSLTASQRHELYDARRAQMLKDKIDLAAYLTHYIETYPV